MPRVIHFEFAAQDPQRAVKFYEDVFGWKITKWEGPMDYWLIVTGEGDEPGIDGAITASPNGVPTVNTIGVSSVDEYTQKIVEAGGTVVMPRTAVPGVGYLAQCTDTEGVLFGLMESDPSAS